MKHFLLHTACLLFSFSAFSQKSLILSGAYLPCKDYTVQTPNRGDAVVNTFGISSGFELQIGVPFRHGFRVETGYRMKQHWLTYNYNVGIISDLIQTTHSSPFRIGYERSLGTRKWLAPFSLSASTGVLVDMMQVSSSSRTINRFQTVTNEGTFLSSNDIQTPNGLISASFDGYCQLNCTLFHSLQFFLGTGYTRGLKPLAEGTYFNHNESTGITTSTGYLLSRGSYRYILLGVRYRVGYQ